MAGRPLGSMTRDRVVAIVSELGKAYGYQIAQVYLDRFPATTKRNIYYHLKKAVALGELKITEIKQEKGEYSWGTSAEKVFYELV